MANLDHHPRKPKGNGVIEHYDAVVIGAGFGGLYALHHLRAMGLSVRVYDGAAREAFAAVLTDLGMPYVDGRRVAAAIKMVLPTTPVILLTGWGQRLGAEDDVPLHVDRVLSKPPKLRDLRVTLAELTA